jgi:hypothetical protein
VRGEDYCVAEGLTERVGLLMKAGILVELIVGNWHSQKVNDRGRCVRCRVRDEETIGSTRQ